MVGDFFKSKKNKSDNLETIAFTNDNVVNENFIKKLNLDTDTSVKDTKILKIDALDTKNISINSQGNSVEITGRQIIKNFDLKDVSINFSETSNVDIDGKVFELSNMKIGGEVFPPLSKKKQKLSFSSLVNLVSPPLKLSDPTQLFKPLWKSQISGIEFLINRHAALLADDPGLGKTVQAIIALKILFQKGQLKRALIVVPKSTIGNKEASIETGDARQWEGHLELWAEELVVKTILPAVWEGGIPPQGFSGSASFDRRKEWKEQAHIYLTTYPLIRNDIKNNAFPRDYFDAIVLDEVHNVKNPNSQQSIALRSLIADFKWGLTGTPVQNYPKEMYAISQFLDPLNFPELRTRDYDEITEQQISTMCKPLFIRRTKKKDDLPPKIRHEHWLTLTENQKAAYESNFQIKRQRLIELSQNGVSDLQKRKSIFGAITNLKQLCNFDPYDFESNKIGILKELISNAIQNNEKIIVFSQFLNFGIDRINDHLRDEGIQSLLLVGNMSMTDRNENIELFKTNDDYKLLLCSLKTAGVGLNLEEASTVIHFDHWWNPAIMWQAEDRAHRYGQTKEVNVHSFWMKNTIEEKIFKLLKSKEAMIKRVLLEMGDSIAENEIEKQIGIEELMDLFDLN